MKTTVKIMFFSVLCLAACRNDVNQDSVQNKQKDSDKLKIERHFNVAPEKVFGAFTNPDEMKVWWTDDTNFDIDLRVGGKYLITRKEGETIHRMTGEFLVVDKPHALSYTCSMPDFSPVIDTISLSIQPDGKGGVHAVFVQEGAGIRAELNETQEGSQSPSEKGWQMGFDLMEAAWNSEAN